MDIYQLSRNWADLVKRARSKQLVGTHRVAGQVLLALACSHTRAIRHIGADSAGVLLSRH